MANHHEKKSTLCDAEWRQCCWLTGTFTQHLLIRIEGKRLKTPDELHRENPELSIADSINLHRDLYGPRMDWDERKVFVTYKGREFDISEDTEKIAEKWISDEGFQMVQAFNEAVETIVSKIAGDQASQRFRNMSAMEIVALG